MDVVYSKKYEDVLNLAAGLNGQNKLEVHKLAAMLVYAEHDYCQRLQSRPQAISKEIFLLCLFGALPLHFLSAKLGHPSSLLVELSCVAILGYALSFLRTKLNRSS
ncbi:hypothetical protein [Helicobacter salomonis]|uniref:hypothetical protein n=1 Tax=Helicobacter salomonis TaxID=56878 RepID=UPI000CF0E2EC|nr:hypothetical protein [Helicobacter salomonis]